MDYVGHAVVVVRLRTYGCKGLGEPESVCLYIPVEAGSIDSFVAKAQSIGDMKGANTYLHMADHTVSLDGKILMLWARRTPISGHNPRKSDASISSGNTAALPSVSVPDGATSTRPRRPKRWNSRRK